MSNDLSVLLRTWLAAGFSANRVLRNSYNLMRTCGKTFDRQPGIKGSTVTVPIPVTKTATAVTPSMTPPTPADTTPTSKTIACDQWYYTDLNLTDKEATQIEAGEFLIPSGIDGCLVGLMENVNAYLHTKTHGATGFFGYVGTAGTNPFASNSDILADASEVFALNKASLGPKPLIIYTDAEKAAKKLSEFRDVSQAGNEQVRRYGMLPPVGGFDPFMDQQTPSHTAGTGSGYLINNGAGYAAGIKTVVVDTGSGTILAGDIVTFAGVTGTYVVTAALSGGSFSFYPGLASAVADNAAVTLKATHRVNVAFEPEAIQLVTRPLISSIQAMAAGQGIRIGGNLVAEADMMDPNGSGLIVRAQCYRGWNMNAFYFDVLYGGDVVRQELGVRLAG